MKNIAVVLLNFNGKNLLEKFLPNIIKSSQEANIYVIDNASTDASIEWLSTTYTDVNVIALDQNYGYAEGYNRGLKHINEPILCLLNTDIEVTENWLQPIATVFKNNVDIGICQPKILSYNNRTDFEYAGAAGGFIDKYGFPYCRGRIFETIEKDNNQYMSSDVFWASGACFFIRKEIFDDLKGFDSDFFAHQEEIDLCWRAFNKQIRTYYCNESTVFHIGGATLDKSNPRKTFLNFRNSLYMIYKNAPLEGRFLLLFQRLSWDGLAGIQLMLQGKPLHCWAVVRSHFAFYQHISSLREKRLVDATRNDYYKVSSIVLEYFLKRKRKFTDL